MNIFDFALNIEKEHKNFYQKKGRESDNEELKSVFKLLAGEEAKHEIIVKQLAEDKKVNQIESEILPEVKTTLESITSDLPGNSLSPDQAEIYRKAETMEKRSRQFYEEKAEASKIKRVRKVFKQLAQEEAKHENIMNNLTKLVDKPNSWLDDAEWYHLEEY